jgi:predicted glutamine amidotransferase
MCRMFGYVGRSRDDLIALHSALRGACANDECLAAAYPRLGHSHDDGWGYVIRASGGLHHYRSAVAIHEDDHPLPPFAEDQEIQAIFHGRLTRGGVVGDPIFSHPYVASTDTALFFFAHNGGLTDDVGKAVKDKVDSEWALDQIIRADGIEAALPKLKAKTQTALNILLMKINRKQRAATMHYLNFYQGRGEAKKDGYYQMYKATMASGGRTVFSSTLRNRLDGAAVTPVNIETVEEL